MADDDVSALRAKVAELTAEREQADAVFAVLERQFGSLQDEHAGVSGERARLQQAHGQLGAFCLDQP